MVGRVCTIWRVRKHTREQTFAAATGVSYPTIPGGSWQARRAILNQHVQSTLNAHTHARRDVLQFKSLKGITFCSCPALCAIPYSFFECFIIWKPFTMMTKVSRSLEWFKENKFSTTVIKNHLSSVHREYFWSKHFHASRKKKVNEFMKRVRENNLPLINFDFASDICFSNNI